MFWAIPEIKYETNKFLEEAMIDLLSEKLQIEILPSEVSSKRRFGTSQSHIRSIYIELVRRKNLKY